MKKLIVTVLTALSLGYLSHARVPGLVPLPVSVVETPGEFIFGPGTVPQYGTCEERDMAAYFAEKIGRPVQSSVLNYTNPANVIIFSIDRGTDLPSEGYRLGIREDTVRLTGKDRGGLFYAVQTLLQLVPAEILGGKEFYHIFSIACVEIKDYPRFGYRGFSFDVARTFTEADGVKRLLDQMVFHKLNRLHWHLTDDEGWRIQLDCFPRLTEEGGFRGGDSPVRNIYGEWGNKYGGYYTKDEIREIVGYAAFLNIEVIPEFDLPGHSRAFARVYPQILCRGHADTAAAGYDMRKVWCADREENYAMIEEILGEILDLFPGKMIHTGGDEVPPEQWNSCPDCRDLMDREGFKDTKALNTYFENRVGRMLRCRRREQVVWNEAVDGGFLDGSAVISAWENEGSVADAVKKGFRTIAMPSQYYYFDMKQSANEFGLAWAAVINTKRAYGYEPVPQGYGDDSILGVEGAFWTETFLWNGPWWLEYQLFPRMCALAERAWSPKESCVWEDFNGRLETDHLERLGALGIAYRGSDGIKTVPAVPSDRIKAGYTVTGSVPCTEKNPYGFAADGDDRTFASTLRTPREGDWFEYTFDKPVKCGSITIKSGYNAIPRFVVGPAVLEVSYDGINYVTVDNNFGYTCTIHPEKAVHKIRLTIKGYGNGEEAAILHDLIILP